MLLRILVELQIRLRKRDYDFSRARSEIAKAEKLRDLRKQSILTNNQSNDDDNNKKNNKNSGETETETKKRRSWDFTGKLILSPLTTVGNLPFRRICKEMGADITCSEMACCIPLLKGLNQEWALTKRHESEDIFGIQLCGNNPNSIVQTAQLLQETVSMDYIDLNLGCPIELIYQNGGGSALMQRQNILELCVRGCSSLLYDVNIPFTVKMRTGVYADKSIAHHLMPLVEEWGASAITVRLNHTFPNHREQTGRKEAYVVGFSSSIFQCCYRFMDVVENNATPKWPIGRISKNALPKYKTFQSLATVIF